MVHGEVYFIRDPSRRIRAFGQRCVRLVRLLGLALKCHGAKVQSGTNCGPRDADVDRV